jgi:glycosyltransferase involved in cell wall biosynthesis
LRVLLICEAVFPENKGGIERWFQTLSSQLQAAGNEVTYFNALSVNQERNGVQYVAGSAGKWSYREGGVRSKTQAIRFGVELFWWLRKQEFDLIYCSSVPIFSIFAVALARNQKPKIFVEWFEVWRFRYWIRYSGLLAGPVGWLVQFGALQIGDHRVVYTNRAKSTVSKLGFANRREVTLLPGICPTDFKAPVNQDGFQKNDVYFLGRFVNEKQPVFAILAIEAFIKTGWDGTFWLLGTGPLADELRRVIEDRKLKSSIELIENPTDDEVREISRRSFALLHPSRREGYGLASVEAAYSGTPSLLINYPDNACVDLAISPELVSKTGKIPEIVSLLAHAQNEQARLRLETLNWALQALETKSTKRTCEEILRIARGNDKK